MAKKQPCKLDINKLQPMPKSVLKMSGVPWYLSSWVQIILIGIICWSAMNIVQKFIK